MSTLLDENTTGTTSKGLREGAFGLGASKLVNAVLRRVDRDHAADRGLLQAAAESVALAPRGKLAVRKDPARVCIP